MTTKPAAARTRPHAHAAARLRRRSARRRRLLAGAAVAAAVGATIVLTVAVAGGDSTPSAAPSGGTNGHPMGSLPAGYRLSGETSPMGAPVLVTPGTRSGTASAGGIVVEGTDIDMGRVPLAYGVIPTWELTNTTDHPVSVAKPKLEIVKGCCPGDIALGTTMLTPGGRTTLRFPLQMHPGMDGDHLFRIAVPVEGSETPLVLSVVGDFS